MKNSTTARPIETRPAFTDAYPHLRNAHRAAQRGMFASANAAGFCTKPQSRDRMIDGINAALGFIGAQRIISRRQMTIDEMHAIAVAIDAGLFGANWNWCEDFLVTVKPVQMSVVHFEPRNTSHTAFSVPVAASADIDDLII